MREVLILLAAIATLTAMRGLFAVAVKDFWWAFPKQQAWMVVALYCGAVAAAVAALVAGGRLTIGKGSRWRLPGLLGLLGGAWALTFLAGNDSRVHLAGYWGVACGQVRPAAVKYNEATQRIQISGPLARGSAARLKEVLESVPSARVVEITSLGGLIDEARWISMQIEARGMDTLVSDECASACVDIFASGRQRFIYANALIGLHSARSFVNDKSAVVAANQSLFDRLYKIGVEPRFLMIGTETPADDIWVNTARQAYLAGLATAVIEPIGSARN